MILYRNDHLELDGYRRFHADDPELVAVHRQWERALRRAVEDLPKIQFNACLPNSQ
jgi:putative proteasome-type protease